MAEPRSLRAWMSEPWPGDLPFKFGSMLGSTASRLQVFAEFAAKDTGGYGIISSGGLYGSTGLDQDEAFACTSPTVQFLVRGHWRQQAHGPGHSLRKPIWIEPFWKGPEEARVLLRQHRVEDQEKPNR